MESLIDYNEKQRHYLYEYFTDEMMMYTFVHKPSHIQEEYNKKEETKKEYIRDLLQFYGMLVSHQAFLKKDVTDFTEGSLLKNLDRRHIRRYQESAEKGGPPAKRKNWLQHRHHGQKDCRHQGLFEVAA